MGSRWLASTAAPGSTARRLPVSRSRPPPSPSCWAPISKVRARFSKPEQLNNLMTRLRLDRSLEKLWSLATITDVDALTTPDPVEGGGDDESDADGEENGGSGE